MNQIGLTVGSLVRASYKTGEYVGEIVEQTSAAKAAVKILAVLNHPTQGNLHHPDNPDVAYFHQRRALSFQEIALMPIDTIRPYHGTVPDYKQSLQQALETDMDQLRRTIRFAEKCLAELEQLKKEY
ncbi:kinase-associated lipoprotein B [Paenibacillus allorhizosphaerae]|uniref:Kinase-associated lipoprotein B n=1 Tax=Paenibacillus allorhizosphaerae TaxID=2849866 RepID=A0ABN7TEY3_9BACL|nr:kinase-associated lipoprotein B [Paenibacillus allorhizosphaerae]CAG7629772.1 Kinase-associated lipoprotein B [Paenibacillus allorhizosphaerae]